MAKQLVNIGVSPNTGGDPARIAFEKVNSNNSELYTVLGADAVTGILPLALPITKGGTGATTKEDAIANLGLGTAALLNVEDLPSDPEYVLPKASDSILGGVKVGSGLSIDIDGVLSAEAQGVSVTSVNGEVGEVVVNAENLTTLNGSTQQEINDRGGATWYVKSGGYGLNDRVILDNGDIVRSTIPSNVNNPNIDMTGWVIPYLVESSNLSDVPDKVVARTNLGVYSTTQVITAISKSATPAATELVAGKAKIATTAIAQAGVNDTDFITAKKLRAALNANGNAPVSTCRAWVVFTCVGSVVTILNSMNILSVTRLGTSNFKITYATPMPTANNVPLASGSAALGTGGQYAMSPAVRNILAGSCEIYHFSPIADFPLVTLGVFC